MNKDTHERLNLFVSLIRTDFQIRNRILEMTFSFPNYIVFSHVQTLLINEAVQEWHDETIIPLLARLFDEFGDMLINKHLIKLAFKRVLEIDQIIINSGGKSIKDQLRNKLGLLPDISNFKIKEDEK